MNVERIDLESWSQALPSSGFDVFHTAEALSVLDEYAQGELTLFGAYKGQQPVALLPVFVRESTVGRVILSPPPSVGTPHMGPIMMPTSPKRRKQEKVNREFTEAVLDALDVSSRFSLFRMVCTPAYTDPRPYSWADLHVEPAFTYAVDVDGATPDELMSRFSSSLRREIRDADELDVEISIEGMDAARRVYETARDRFEEQDESFAMEWAYVRDLVEALGDRSRVYVARDGDGTFLTGITVLYSNDAAFFWQGGARTTYESVSINSLLHWHIIEDIAGDPALESITAYDMVGANTPRLCRYKAKFGAELVPYYVVESAGTGIDMAKRAYQLVRH